MKINGVDLLTTEIEYELEVETRLSGLYARLFSHFLTEVGYPCAT